MGKAIYKVTSKKVTELLETEQKRKDRYMPSIVRKTKKLMPGILNVSFRDDGWCGSIKPGALVFTDEVEKTLDKKLWKEVGTVFANKKWRKTYWPKLNNKAGKELASKFNKVMVSEKFFQSDEILKAVGYKPKNQVDNISPNRISVNTFGVGYATKKGKKTFIFSGYDGYKPIRGVKEMLTSEYNKMFKE